MYQPRFIAAIFAGAALVLVDTKVERMIRSLAAYMAAELWDFKDGRVFNSNCTTPTVLIK